jgi:DNA-directed RNA polymerase specialized sigma24 family protein
MDGRWSAEELDRLERAALKLRPIELEVLLLSAQDRLPNHQIAARLGITTDAAEGHLADALYHLNRNMDREERPWWKFW